MSKERFHEIVKEMVEIHDRKNRDYAGNEYLSNFFLLIAGKHAAMKKARPFYPLSD